MVIGGLIVMWPQAERRRAQGGYAAVMPPSQPARRASSFGMTTFVMRRGETFSLASPERRAAAVMSRERLARSSAARCTTRASPPRHDEPVRDGPERGANGAASAQAWRKPRC